MPLIVLTASSIGLVSCVSTSSALAPGRLTPTVTVGESVFGIRSRPSSPVREPAQDDERRGHHDGEDRPLDADVREIHCAPSLPAGRAAARPAALTATAAPAAPPPPPAAGARRPAAAAAAFGLARLEHPHRHARRQLVQPAGREHLVALEAVGDFPDVALPDAERDALLRDLAVSDDVDRRHAGQRRHRGVGHGHHVVVDAREDDALGEEAGLEQAVRVLDQRLDREGAHRLIERRADVRDLALEHRGRRTTRRGTGPAGPAVTTPAWRSCTPVLSFSGSICTMVATTVRSRDELADLHRTLGDHAARWARAPPRRSASSAPGRTAARRSCRMRLGGVHGVERGLVGRLGDLEPGLGRSAALRTTRCRARSSTFARSKAAFASSRLAIAVRDRRRSLRRPARARCVSTGPRMPSWARVCSSALSARSSASASSLRLELDERRADLHLAADLDEHLADDARGLGADLGLSRATAACRPGRSGAGRTSAGSCVVLTATPAPPRPPRPPGPPAVWFWHPVEQQPGYERRRRRPARPCATPFSGTRMSLSCLYL